MLCHLFGRDEVEAAHGQRRTAPPRQSDVERAHLGARIRVVHHHRAARGEGLRGSLHALLLRLQSVPEKGTTKRAPIESTPTRAIGES